MDRGVYCYTIMPFRLKNDGSIYQWLMNKIFYNQLGRRIETYIDDLLIKSRVVKNFISDLKEAFEVLRSSRMMLNLEKCVFRVRSGKFLGYTISQRRIGANSDKIRAIQDRTSSRLVKDIQRLIGRLAALNRFLSRSAQQSLLFFKTT